MKCIHCGQEVQERPDGTWRHKRTALQLCTNLGTKYATPEPELDETADYQASVRAAREELRELRARGSK